MKKYALVGLLFFIVQILSDEKWVDVSQHSLKVDAERQITIFVDHDIPLQNLRIVEKDTFEPAEVDL